MNLTVVHPQNYKEISDKNEHSLFIAPDIK